MLTHNLDVEDGLVNGSVGRVVHFENNHPIIQFKDTTRVIYTIGRDIMVDDKKIMTITYLPLRLAYAFTIHKMQGATIDCAEIDFKNIFEYGQAYVALSRVKSLDSLYIRNFDKKKITAHPKVIAYYNNISQ